MTSSLLALLVALAPQKHLPAVDAIVAKAVDAAGPGAVVGVARNGEVLHLAATGVATPGGEPLSPESRFLVASTSKAATAACVALLAKDGRISLDDDVRKHVPEVPDLGAKITLHHLLHHRSGLRDFYELRILAGLPIDADFGPRDVMDLVKRQKETSFAPGSDALYSNTGYFLLAEVVARASGKKSLRAFADERVFRPLGMTRTFFRDDASEAVDGLVPGHEPRGGAIEARGPSPAIVGPGGLVTTVPDLLRFEAALRSGPLAALKLDEAPPLAPAERRDPILGRYAFGCLAGTRDGLRVAMSPGGSFGYQSQFLRAPDSGLAVVVLANSSLVGATQLGLEIARAVLGTPPPAPPKGAGAPVPPPAGFHLLRDRATGDVLVFSSRGENPKIATLGWKAALAPTAGRALVATDTLIPLAFRWAPAADGGDKPASATLEIEGEAARSYQAFPPFRSAPEDLAALVGEWASDEVGTPLRIVEKRGAIAIDDASFAMPVPPFLFASKDVLVSDAPARIDVESRDAAGKAVVVRVSTGRARNVRYERKG